MHVRTLISGSIMLAGLALCPALAADEPNVARVTMCQGDVRVKAADAWTRCRIFSGLQAGEKMHLSAGSRVMIFFFKSRRTEVIDGSTEFVVAGDSSHLPPAHMHARIPPSVLLAGQDLSTVASDQYAVGVRRKSTDGQAELISYIPARSVSTTPLLAWSPLAGGSPYRFTIKEDGDPPFVDVTTEEPTAKLSQSLQAGHTYHYSIQAGDQKVESELEIVPADEALRIQQARQAFASAVRTDPQDVAPYLLLADSYSSHRLTYDAIEVLEQAVVRYPDDPLPHRWLFRLYGDAGRWDKQQAEESWLKANHELSQR